MALVYAGYLPLCELGKQMVVLTESPQYPHRF